jgi:L-ascorbate metabolism protein UlaG (beta-lactamase superfamily)
VRLIKYTHACVRLEDGERALVIDPGTWSEPEAIEGVDDILVTHEHYDHINIELLEEAADTNPRLRIYTHADLASQLESLHKHVTTVAVGQTFTAAGFEVRVVGGHHAEIFDGLPGCANVGFIVNDLVYHPGDSFFVPDQDIEHLLVPASAPWLKLGEALTFVRAVRPRRAYPIHEMLLSETGMENFGRWMGMKGETDYRRLEAGEAATLA